MDKSKVKNFAVSARVKLKEQIEQKAYTFGITKAEIKKVEVFEDTFVVNGNKYNKGLLKHRESLVKRIIEKDFDQVIEEVAYTWFNRLIAIRFMEVNEYLPTGVRVLSSTNSDKSEPDIIREAANLDFENLNIDLIYKLQDENNSEELFKYLLIKQCNELGKIMPVVFEEIEDYTELLLPDNLLQEGSIIRDLVTSISEEDFKEQVEIIGWLYQYYISEKKDEVFEALKRNVKITKENIPAATQLFTPDWIVKYMVENSLGRLWLEGHPNEELKSKWKYYLEEAEQEPEVQKQLEEIRNKDINPQEIKVLDPCMGSGHILVYMFDVLYDIYKSAGYVEREIPKLILEKNLYGLDIDDRAAQLAYFAVMMKARSYNRRIFREKIELNICSIQESNDFPKEAIDYLVKEWDYGVFQEPDLAEVALTSLRDVPRVRREDVEYLIDVFKDAKEYGSILEVKEIDFEAIERRIDEIRNGETIDIFDWQYKNIILGKITTLIKQGKIMSEKYAVIVTNPPYMGNGGMNESLAEYVKKVYPNTKSDLSTVFMEKSIVLLKKNGYVGMINIPTWMFLSSYENLRNELINNRCFINLLHLGRGIFGSDFGTTAFIIQNKVSMSYKGLYKRLFDKQGSVDNIEKKEKMFFENHRDYCYLQKNYRIINGLPIAYWASNDDLSVFEKNTSLGTIANPRQGLATGENNRFLRFWYEVDINNIGFHYKNRLEAKSSEKKWFPYNKGGEFRKWYGNNYYVVNWYDDGNEIRNFKDENGKLRSRPQNMDCYFKECVTWSKVTIGGFSTRYEPYGFLFDVAGCSIFVDKKLLNYILGLTNSKVTQRVLSFLSPTVNYEVGHIANIPVFYSDEQQNIDNAVRENIEIAKSDWDSSEISWDFSKHPLLKFINTKSIKRACNLLSDYIQMQRLQSRNNEEKINELIINIYGLNKQLDPYITDDDITTRKPDTNRDVKSFISFAVGVMVCRYSLVDEGLTYAGGEFNPNKYKAFKVDKHNVIPITDDEYFEDDIVSRFVEFVKTTFSEESLEENLDFIADTLGKKANETSRQTIRRYFLKDFYKDHLQTYQKRPIYWLFDSGKNDGFKALIYMHRYDETTVAKVRTDYLHLLQRKYEAEVNRLDMVLENSNASTREKTEAKKKKEKIQKQIIECVQYDQVIAHVANQKISIDLDDGVVVNYGKFQGVEVPQGEGKKALKADLLVKI